MIRDRQARVRAPEDTQIKHPRGLSRRSLLLGGGLALASVPATARAATRIAGLRGTIEASEFGVRPNAGDDQSALLQKAINASVERGRALFLPGGHYPVANLRLPGGARLVGIPGQTWFDYLGGGHLIYSEKGAAIGLEGIHFDGGNRHLGDYTPALLHFSDATDLSLESCTISGSAKTGLALDRCSGRVTACTISGARQAGLRSVEATGLSITDCHVHDCANAGILVYRWTEGEDGTLVSGNRVERIAAKDGGTGQNGNGINVFRAHGVIVSGNRVTDCAFSAIRANAGSNIVINGNSCLRSGETAIYSEFAFQGAVIADNLVDGGTIGISIANFLDGGRLATCSGNVVRNLTVDGPYPAEVQGFGIGIAVEADTALTGNVIEGAPRFGIHMGWGPYLRNVNATSNVIRACPTGIGVTVVEGAGPALIASNIIQDAKQGAIIGHRWKEAVTRDLTQAGTEAFPHLTIQGNVVS
ncbi:TIGR03808 family TAT-translocated repetitive protein [Stappia taiwanensis]|uniref:TIGR03808 family TAT-translocated repetitive protein n=1 Tax=Stappia taiwanensis TaxID=992267 RepID=A0A838XVF8_9HYPH|nr:TIGR03808 family TAT-translocated repetitive protein [Stappia taiwanensis]MBA4610830.1 TIGR03808 family TAT-translocated repetitive protein [Stappia taiwanensis]GGE95524.1 Tat protein [Stappia taiwanensis]